MLDGGFNRPAGMSFMAKKKSKREDVWLECSQCGSRNYRTNISVAEGTPKLEFHKFCSKERTRTVHKIRRK
jgi:large subunit ribosomal protein L33